MICFSLECHKILCYLTSAKLVWGFSKSSNFASQDFSTVFSGSSSRESANAEKAASLADPTTVETLLPRAEEVKKARQSIISADNRNEESDNFIV
jgi:hypothetical protein